MLVRLIKLLDYIQSPIENLPWNCDEFTPNDVRVAYRKKQFQITHGTLDDKSSREWNIQRIAYFIKRMPSEPIQVDVGIPSIGFYPNDVVSDGWHRIYAAILRRDKYINASVAGEVSVINKLKF